MVAEEWRPSDVDHWVGREAYLHYLGGVVLLHDPESQLAQGIIGEVWHDSVASNEVVVAQAEDIMYHGLQTMITVANPPQFRSPITMAEPRYDESMPHIRDIVVATFQDESERLEHMNPGFWMMRPMPLRSPAVYRHICHGRRQLLTTRRLLDGYMAAPVFLDIVAGRHLPGQPRQHRRTNGADS